MTALSGEAWNRRATFRAYLAVIGLTLASLGTTGCAHRIYQPTALPDRLLARPIPKPDLSTLPSVLVSNDRIDRGDLLEVTINSGFAGLPTRPLTIQVGESGAADIPPIRQVSLAGLTPEAAAQMIAVAGVQRRVFRNPHVAVSVKDKRKNTIMVGGAVEKPGEYPLARGTQPAGYSSLAAAILSAGGFSDNAGLIVEVRRAAAPGTAPAPFHPPGERVASQGGVEQTAYQSASSSGASVFQVSLAGPADARNPGYYLADGDEVIVKERNLEPVHVIGLVNKPGDFPYPVGTEPRVLDALAWAGGNRMRTADKIHVIRRVPGEEEPAVIKISLREAKGNGQVNNVLLASGDIISVEETPATFVEEILKTIVRISVGSKTVLF